MAQGIVDVASSLQSSRFRGSVSAAVAGKTLDAQKMTGQMALQLIESAAQAQTGQRVSRLVNLTA